MKPDLAWLTSRKPSLKAMAAIAVSMYSLAALTANFFHFAPPWLPILLAIAGFIATIQLIAQFIKGGIGFIRRRFEHRTGPYGRFIMFVFRDFTAGWSVYKLLSFAFFLGVMVPFFFYAMATSAKEAFFLRLGVALPAWFATRFADLALKEAKIEFKLLKANEQSQLVEKIRGFCCSPFAGLLHLLELYFHSRLYSVDQ